MTQSTAAKIYSLLASARSLTTEEIHRTLGRENNEIIGEALHALRILDMIKYTDGNWSRPDVGRIEP